MGGRRTPRIDQINGMPSPIELRQPPSWAAQSQLQRFITWLGETGHDIDDYPSLLQWSCSQRDAFWKALTTYSGMFPSIDECAMSALLPDRPGHAQWAVFTNYAALLLRELNDDAIAVDEITQDGELRSLTRRQLRAVVAALAARLSSLSVGAGSMVLGHSTNSIAGLCGMLAAASVGACYFAVDARVPLHAVANRLQHAPIPGGEITLILEESAPDACHECDDLQAVPRLMLQWGSDTEGNGGSSVNNESPKATAFVIDASADPDVPFSPVKVSVNTPLFLLTETSLESQQPMVQVWHMQAALEYYKVAALHMNLQDATPVTLLAEPGDMHWYIGFAALMLGCRLSLRDPVPMRRGDAALKSTEQGEQVLISDPDVLWSGLFKYNSDALASLLRRSEAVHLFGDHLANSVQDKMGELCRDDCWINLQLPVVRAASIVLGGAPVLPNAAGCSQVVALGASVEIKTEPYTRDAGGELLLTQLPFPSPQFGLPITSGVNVRLAEAGGFMLLGASNRSFARYGAHVEVQDFYTQVLAISHVIGVMAACCKLEGGRYFFPVFLQLEEGAQLNEVCKERVQQLLKQFVDPRLLPDQIYQVPDMLISHNGRILSSSLEKLLVEGSCDMDEIKRRCAKPEVVDWYGEFRSGRAFMFEG